MSARRILQLDGEPTHSVEECAGFDLLRLESSDGTNRLTRARVTALTLEVENLGKLAEPKPLIIAGNNHFFSAGADINQIAKLHGPNAYEFALMGQRLMRAVARFPAQVTAVIEGWCMGGGLDLALACHRRVATPHAIFGHRGAALGIMTGWGGTQRLPRLLGKSHALQMFLAAEKVPAERALALGLVDELISDDLMTYCLRVQYP